jgi:hypothetical protein
MLSLTILIVRTNEAPGFVRPQAARLHDGRRTS